MVFVVKILKNTSLPPSFLPIKSLISIAYYQSSLAIWQNFDQKFAILNYFLYLCRLFVCAHPLCVLAMRITIMNRPRQIK